MNVLFCLTRFPPEIERKRVVKAKERARRNALIQDERRKMLERQMEIDRKQFGSCNITGHYKKNNGSYDWVLCN